MMKQVSLYEKLMNSSRVVSFGCSFVYGDELHDCDWQTPSKFTAPALMAKEANVDYKTYSFSGSGNDRIVRTIQDYLLNDYREGDFVFIGWTNICRMEFYVPPLNSYINFLPNVEVIKKHEKLSKSDFSKIKFIEDYYYDIITTKSFEQMNEEFYQKINFTYAALEYYKLPFIMVRMLSYSDKINKNDKITNLITKKLKSHAKFYDEYESMSVYLSSIARNTNGLFMPQRHPSLKGHAMIKEKIVEFMKKTHDEN